jgi:hypothetical protein
MTTINHKTALEILEITLKKGEKLDLKYLKKQYHKLALENHPDKNDNSFESTEKFKQINESYNLLKREISFINNFEDDESEPESENDLNDKYTYVNILKVFINNFVQESLKNPNNCNYKELINNIISDIVSGCKKISLKLFEKLDKDSALEIYNFLSKYKIILHIHQDTIDEVKKIIMEKYINDQIYILNPSIDDLLDNNIYKLDICGNIYYVPLWHDEVYFDNNVKNDKSCDDEKSEIIVKCIPQLPNNITIDENNNIIVNVDISFTFSLFNEERIMIKLGKKSFDIKINELYLKRFQTYYFYNQGITEIDSSNLYLMGKKSHIICNIFFTR